MKLSSIEWLIILRFLRYSLSLQQLSKPRQDDADRIFKTFPRWSFCEEYLKNHRGKVGVVCKHCGGHQQIWDKYNKYWTCKGCPQGLIRNSKVVLRMYIHKDPSWASIEKTAMIHTAISNAKSLSLDMYHGIKKTSSFRVIWRNSAGSSTANHLVIDFWQASCCGCVPIDRCFNTEPMIEENHSIEDNYRIS